MSRIVAAAAVLASLGLLPGSAVAEKPAALSQISSCEFVDTRLDHALQFLSQQHNIPIRLNVKIVEKVGIPKDEPLNLVIEGVTLESLLKNVLDPFVLTAIVLPDGSLEVTTAWDADARVDTRRYDLRPIAGLKRASGEQIALTVMHTTKGPWNWINGMGGTIKFDGQTLVVEQQSARAHEEIAELLTLMTRVSNPADAPPLTTKEQNEQAIRDKLGQSHDIEWIQFPLRDMADFTQQLIGAPVLIDEVELTRASISVDATVDAVAKDAVLSELLDQTLRPLKLTWIIEDEVVKITTRVRGNDRMVLRVYEVKERLQGQWFGNLANKLMDEVQSLEGLHWETIDGIGGSLRVLNNMLIVRQSQAGHDQIAELLK